LRASGAPGIFRPPAPVSVPPMAVALFADFACPFSYVTETALRRMEAAGEVRLTPFAWELYPAPAHPPAAEPMGWRERIAPLAAEVGLAFGAPPVPARTRKAHE
jgi:predicted DsbA family dithiol-disulfide isomerase